MAGFRPLAPARYAGDVSHYWRDDESGGGEILSVQDVAPLLEQNKILKNSGDGYSPSRELRRAASIPAIVISQWLSEGVDIWNPDHKDEIKRRLNSSDWAHLRTAPGRL